VGAFAFIITNFNALSRILFHSFAGLGILATGSNLAEGDLLRPGRLAAVGMTAAQPILDRLSVLTGFPDVFLNLDTIMVLLLAWVIVIIAFFVLAVQLFVTLIEFKLTTLAGFVLVPFALWNKTAFLAERVLGNVVSSGIKVLVLAVIVGIGAGIFGQFTVPPAGGITVNSALALMLASLALFGLGLFGPGIATGLVSGAPQLGAGAVAGTALATAGLAVAGGAVTVSAARAAASLVKRDDSPSPPSISSPPSGPSAAAGPATPPAGTSGGASVALAEAEEIEPQWARDLKRRQTVSHGVTTAAHVVRSTDHGGAGASPDLDAGD
jgi:type IV secretion system protein TrbL